MADEHATEAEWRARADAMVRTQIEARGVRDPRVLAAFRDVPRQRFVPEAYRARAYEDGPLPIGHGQTISQPYVVASMTEQLALEPGDRVLEIGTGSGYQAAVLAAPRRARSTRSRSCAARGAREARRSRSSAPRTSRCFTGDGYRGWPEHAPFDAILVTAAPDGGAAAAGRPARGRRAARRAGRRASTRSCACSSARRAAIETKILYPVRFVPFVRGGKGTRRGLRRSVRRTLELDRVAVRIADVHRGARAERAVARADVAGRDAVRGQVVAQRASSNDASCTQKWSTFLPSGAGGPPPARPSGESTTTRSMRLAPARSCTSPSASSAAPRGSRARRRRSAARARDRRRARRRGRGRGSRSRPCARGKRRRAGVEAGARARLAERGDSRAMRAAAGRARPIAVQTAIAAISASAWRGSARRWSQPPTPGSPCPGCARGRRGAARETRSPPRGGRAIRCLLPTARAVRGRGRKNGFSGDSRAASTSSRAGAPRRPAASARAVAARLLR